MSVTITETSAILDWLETRAKLNGGVIPRFTHSDAMAHLGKENAQKYSRAHAQVQSRIDFACFKCGLPPLGFAVDSPFPGSLSDDGRDWKLPVERMMVAAQTRVWTQTDFDAIRAEVSRLPLRISASWNDAFVNKAADVKAWGDSFLHYEGTPHVPLAPDAPPKVLSSAPWTADELILALDLYLSTYRTRAPDSSHKEVHDLSDLLQRLGKALGAQAKETYRNHNGVAMKLSNFSSIDPVRVDKGKSGLKQGGKLDIAIWQQYAHQPDALSKAAAAIRNRLQQMEDSGEDLDSDDWEDGMEAPEGRLLTKTHRKKERNAKLVRKCKERALKKYGFLSCCACQFRFSDVYGGDAAHIIDCHHTKPVHTLGEDGATKVSDLVLLCSNCHRVVHAFSPWLTIPQLVERLKKQSSAPALASGLAGIREILPT